MKLSKYLRIRSRIALSAALTALSKYTISKAGQQDNTSERTCACSVPCAITSFIQYPARWDCPKAKHSTPRDYVIRFTGRPERLPAFVIVMACLMVVSLCLLGHVIVEGIVYLWRMST